MTVDTFEGAVAISHSIYFRLLATFYFTIYSIVYIISMLLYGGTVTVDIVKS